MSEPDEQEAKKVVKLFVAAILMHAQLTRPGPHEADVARMHARDQADLLMKECGL